VFSTALEHRPSPGRFGTSREEAGRARLIDTSVVAAPALLALALCLYQITTRSLWLDESATVAIASQHGAAFGSALAHDGGNMLAYYALLHVLIGLFGSGALVLRLPAAVGTAVTAGLVGLLGLRLASRRTALAAGILSAVSLSLVYWGQNARGYTLMIALIVWSFVALVSIVEGRGRRSSWIAYVVSITAAIYLGLEAVLVVPAQLVGLLWFRDRWRAVLSAVALSAACCIPLAVLASQRGAGQLFWVPGPSFRVLKQIVQALTSAGLQPSYYTSTTTALVLLTLACLLWGAVRALQLRTWQLGLTLAWLLVPALVALLESAAGQSIFQARYLLVSLPAVSLMLAWALVELPVARGVGLGVLAALIVLRALQLAPAYGTSSENWREATAYVIVHRQPKDCTAFYPGDGRMAFRYYLQDPGGAPTPILPASPWRIVRPYVEYYASLPPAQLATLPSRCNRVWFVTRNGGGAGGTTVSRANYQRLGDLRRVFQRSYPLARTSAFGQAQLLTVTLYAR
jgi:mannosyltransferase